ncbi:MAG: hypothetical protein MSG78_05635, partial [Clostridiales bacterium]|nr:hypothetical protein [Clostridiales bacterium]
MWLKNLGLLSRFYGISRIPSRVLHTANNIAHCQEKGWNYIIRSKESYGIKYTTPSTDTFDIDTTITLTRRQTKETRALIQ